MNKFIKNMHTIYNNSFIFTPLLVEFYKTLPTTENNILLAYLVLPLVLHESSKGTLKNVKSSSSIYTFTDTKNKTKQDSLFGLQDRIINYKKLTNQCLQHAINGNFIEIEDNLSIKFTKQLENNTIFLSESFKASSNLCKIFKDLDAITIYKLLGIKKL